MNQSSTAAWMYANYYGLAKVGINGITQQTAAELGGRGIRVNAIAPGPVDTDAMRSTVPDGMIPHMMKDLLHQTARYDRRPRRAVPVPAVR